MWRRIMELYIPSDWLVWLKNDLETCEGVLKFMWHYWKAKTTSVTIMHYYNSVLLL